MLHSSGGIFSGVFGARPATFLRQLLPRRQDDNFSLAVDGGNKRRRLPATPEPPYEHVNRYAPQYSPLKDLTRTPLASTDLYVWASSGTPHFECSQAGRRISWEHESKTSADLPGFDENNRIDLEKKQLRRAHAKLF